MKSILEQVFNTFLKDVCKELNITTGVILSKTREQPYVTIRHFLMHAAVTHFQLTLPFIGKIFNRHHASVIHARDKVSKVINKRELTFSEKIYIEAINSALSRVRLN